MEPGSGLVPYFVCGELLTAGWSLGASVGKGGEQALTVGG